MMVLKRELKKSDDLFFQMLKTNALNMLTEAVQDGVQAMRDPVGGSVEFHFVPILKLISTLLIMGAFDDEDVTHILKMLEPTVFSGKKEEEPVEDNADTVEQKEQETPQQAGTVKGQQQEAIGEEEFEEEFEEEEFEDDGLGEEEEEEMEQEEVESTKAIVPHEEQDEETERMNVDKGAEETEKEKHLEARGESEESLEEGLFQMKLPESVKLQVCSIFLVCTAESRIEVIHFVFVPQMCTLLQYFCDCELRHRVEAIIAFSDMFVSQIQSNQRQRYNELMLAFTMSAAETARKTREFRSPPQEQVTLHKCQEGQNLSLLITHFKLMLIFGFV